MIYIGQRRKSRAEAISGTRLLRHAPRSQLHKINYTPTQHRSVSENVAILMSSSLACSPFSICPSLHTVWSASSVPGAEVKRNDALRVGSDAPDDEEHVLVSRSGQQNQHFQLSRISLSRPNFWWCRKLTVHLTQPSPCEPQRMPW